MSQTSLRILCVHGVGHEEAQPRWMDDWRQAIADGVRQWNAARAVECEFVRYDDLFAAAPLNPATVAEAIAKLVASGVWHGLGDLFARRRGLFELPDRLRWTAGMVAQWAENDALRAAARQRVLEHVEKFQPTVICAHSLGSLISYDLFGRKQHEAAIAGRRFVSFGSQIGNPFVRSALGGRIKELAQARMWFHLFNEHDDAFTAKIRLNAENFCQVDTRFDIEGILDHDAVAYLKHPQTTATVWREIAGGSAARAFTERVRQLKPAIKRSQRRALLVGINDYPDEANRLEGCVNDVFLMSSALQEIGFQPEDIRVVLDERATAKGILERLEWLLDGAGEGDARVFFYSGHGAQLPGYGAHEQVDRQDECLVPHDFDWSRERAVIDDQFYELYSQLPYKANFLAIFDCCHSGGMTRDSGLRVRGLNPPDDIRHRLLKWNPTEQMWEVRKVRLANLDADKWTEKTTFDKAAMAGESGAVRKLGRAVALRSLSDDAYNRARNEFDHKGAYLPVILQACQEREFAAEYRHGVQSYGAFTYALALVFRENLTKKEPLRWQELVKRAAEKLKRLGYAQTPALVCPKVLRDQPIPHAVSDMGA
ncbi:MAG: caspase family protein [Verrucomicrobia bacterium]|nr:caspase family protein [Verrucomicrobiota bacterium]